MDPLINIVPKSMLPMGIAIKERGLPSMVVGWGIVGGWGLKTSSSRTASDGKALFVNSPSPPPLDPQRVHEGVPH
jgi:hypothetical protein